jgi:hypothetical protein
VLCTSEYKLVGTGILALNTNMIYINVEFLPFTNAIIYLNNEATNGIISIFQPKKPVRTLNLNYLPNFL